jgi:hypothetical protein
MRVGQMAKQIAMLSAPPLLVVFSLLHGGHSWSETRALADAGVETWVQHISSIQVRWLWVHLGGIGLFPLLGVVVWWMLAPEHWATWISRGFLVVYMALYTALDALLGLGSYVLIHHREGLTVAERPVLDGAFADLFFYSDVTDRLGTAASWAWMIAILAAAVVLWRTRGWAVVLPLAVSGVALGQSHFPPYGVIAGVALWIAVWQFLRWERVTAGAAHT